MKILQFVKNDQKRFTLFDHNKNILYQSNSPHNVAITILTYHEYDEPNLFSFTLNDSDVNRTFSLRDFESLIRYFDRIKKI